VVSIKVVSEATGNVVHQSRVVVYSGGNHEQYTDEKGLAHFESISPGSYTVYVDGKERQGKGRLAALWRHARLHLRSL
jgi:protocatechuate 3,4-dioxygenase beta subunit